MVKVSLIEIIIYFELIENKTHNIRKCWDAAKTLLREKLIALNAYIRREEECQIDNLSFYLTKLEKKSKLKSGKSNEERK